MSRSEEMLKTMSAEEQAEAKKLIAGIDFNDIFKDLDLSKFGKQIAKALIDFIQANVLPKVQSTNAMLGFVLAGLLDALEGQLK
jgi:hypothetical protein